MNYTVCECTSDGIEEPENAETVERQIAADLAEIEAIDESITRAIRMGTQLSGYEDRVKGVIQDLEARQTQVKSFLVARQTVLEKIKEKGNRGPNS